jgi:2-polyprenyl-3-methyl-5-hydroxy-6-metoxy-1,4-benzoquinol methylase
MKKFSVRNGAPYIETDLDAASLASKLKKWAPWRHQIIFSNGVATGQFDRGPFWTEQPLFKIERFERQIDLGRLKGGRALDIGCNIGYNSLYLGNKYGMTVTGVEMDHRLLEVASFLKELSGVEGVDFVQGDANFFCQANTFDLSLHLGTLYHLRHPVLSLENCWNSLRDDGSLFLETQAFEDEDPLVCKCMLGTTPDPTNWWALGQGAIMSLMDRIGFRNMRLVDKIRPSSIGPKMSRLLFIAEK